ncbi:MAG TPA: DUF11 domain-containing protein [Armatimonadota bacterium]|nr:DUF11 domain-containing protein [Armatimonadota bacterium]
MESRKIHSNLLTAALWIIAASLFPSAGKAATISSLKANTNTVGMYEKYELTFSLTGVSPSNYNPFRWETTGDSLSPAGVNVRGEVVTPSGSTRTVWGFYDVDLVYLGNSTKHPREDRMVPVSAPHWHIRYAPTMLGVHRITVKVTDASGTTSSSQLTFNCIESGLRGFVRVSEDGTRFVCSDGSPFVQFGMMMPAGTDKVAPVTAAMKANGMNFLRRWLVNRDIDDIFRNFETWYSFTVDTSVYRSGKRSGTKAVTGAGTLVDQSFIGCKPNTYYKAYAYLKTSSSFNGQVAVNVNEDGAEGSTVSHTGTKIGANQSWALSQIIFKTGGTAEMLHFKPKIISGTSGTVWIDDVGLYECDSSGNVTVDYNMVFSPGFEEWTPAQLRMEPLARFEYLLRECEANGIVVQATMFDYRLWNKTSPIGFYAQYFADWWTDAASIAQQERALRYVVARFAHYRSLFAWELTNEMDASYTDVRGNWIAGRANFIRSGDPYGHLITNSYWGSPGDYEYGQLEELDLNQVHNYINTEERAGGQGYPIWWGISSGMSLDTNPANAASGTKSLKAVANGSTISETAEVYCKPARSYTLRYKIKTSSVTGKASVIVRFSGGSSPGSTITLDHSGTAGYTSHSKTFTTGSTAVSFTISPQLTGSSGTAWWDDIEVIDNVTGYPCLYNGGFECLPLGDDEFEWARLHTVRCQRTFEAGPNGTNKPWASGEFGLMGADYDLSYWARYGDTTKPRHDSTGIHAHNCIWAQLMACSALNTPTYWWVTEYILPYGLYGVWKGATSFAANLPFYDRGTLVSTDSCAEVCASSTDSRIRVLGQKKASSGYFWIHNSQHTWSRVVREGLTPTAASATLTIPGFEDGAYSISWYDTYTGALVRTESQNVIGGTLKLSVSSLSKDIAAILTKQETQPRVSLTLTADKLLAAPTEVVTYTVSYRNEGAGDAVNVEVKLPIPANTTYISGSASPGGTYDPVASCVRWTLAILPLGASGECTAKVKVD